jgi:hypothetical protein
LEEKYSESGAAHTRKALAVMAERPQKHLKSDKKKSDNFCNFA